MNRESRSFQPGIVGVVYGAGDPAQIEVRVCWVEQNVIPDRLQNGWHDESHRGQPTEEIGAKVHRPCGDGLDIPVWRQLFERWPPEKPVRNIDHVLDALGKHPRQRPDVDEGFHAGQSERIRKIDRAQIARRPVPAVEVFHRRLPAKSECGRLILRSSDAVKPHR